MNKGYLLPYAALGVKENTVSMVAVEEDEHRFRHQYILGRSGSGKSTLLHNLIKDDIDFGASVVVIDPAGKLAKDTLSTVPPSRWDDVVYFSLDSPIPINPLQTRKGNSGNTGKIVNEFIELIDRVVTAESTAIPMTPRIKRILREALQVLIRKEDLTILDLKRFLTSKTERLSYLAMLGAQESEFWGASGEFEKNRTDWKASIDGILDRLDNLIMDERVQKVVCADNELDFRSLVDESKIFVANLEGIEGLLKHFLGNLLIYQLETVLLEDYERRKNPVLICLDEFQTYVSPSFATILQQGRKYRCSLTLSHQNHDAIPGWLLGAILGNMYTIVCFSCGSKEAERMAREFGIKTHDLIFLEDYRAYVRIGTQVHTIETFPPQRGGTDINRFIYIRKPIFKENTGKRYVGSSWMEV